MVKPKPKQMGNPNNQTVRSFRGVSAEVLRAKRLASKSPAGQSDRVVSYDPAAVRDAIEAQKCPFCGNGPYQVLAMHTNHAHGVDSAELRRIAGLSGRSSICSPETSERRRTRMMRPEERVVTERARTVVVQRLRSAMEERHSKWAAEFAQLGGNYEAVKEMALRHGITKCNMRRHLLAAGCEVPMGPLGGESRAKRITEEERRKIVEAHQQGLSQKRISQRLEMSRTRVRRVLRQAGLADVPSPQGDAGTVRPSEVSA